MKTIVAQLEKYWVVVCAAAALFWLSGYFVTKAEYQKDQTAYERDRSDFMSALVRIEGDVKEILKQQGNR